MIAQEVYDQYFNALLKGDRVRCTQMVQTLLDQGIDIQVLYRQLFEKSLYQIGEMWEQNLISVAREHLVTAITENLLNLVYPFLFSQRKLERKVIISCAANEHHQIGGKMVADIFEMNGWDSYFLGANTPTDQMISFIGEIKPDLVGLSLSIYFNVPSLQQGIEAITREYPELDIIVGGQAFRWGEISFLKKYSQVQYMKSIEDLENQLKKE